MKSISLYQVVGASLLSGGLLLGGLAYAHSDSESGERKCHEGKEHRDGWFGKHKRGHHGPMGQVKHLVKKLDLSDEQREEVRGIIKEVKPEFKEHMIALRNNQHKLHNQIGTESFDQEQVQATAEAQGELTQELVMLSAQVHADIFKVLTAEQREKAQALIEKKGKHFKKHE